MKGPGKTQFLILIVIIVFYPPYVVGNKNVPWDECTNLLVKILDCSNKLHIPETCDGKNKSELMTCAEIVMENLSTCKDPIGIRMLSHFVAAYRQSDEILCQSRLHAEFTKNKACVWPARKIAKQIAEISPGTLTDKGCKALNTMFYLHSTKDVKAGCFEMLKEYATAIYAKSFCSHVIVQPPTQSDFDNLNDIATHLIACWVVHPSLPTCTNYYSNRMHCINGTNTKIAHELFKPLINNFIEISMHVDRAICGNKQLQKDFKESRDCWSYVKNVGLLILGQANGLLTEDGCQAVKYRENIEMAKFDQKCLSLLLDFRKYMNGVLPCAPNGVLPSTEDGFWTQPYSPTEQTVDDYDDDDGDNTISYNTESPTTKASCTRLESNWKTFIFCSLIIFMYFYSK